MSSDEVAELAEAIHSHADALYESWTKGKSPRNQGDRHMRNRMEDTLELLADPELTPSLESLVSNFVKRDKAKRQQFVNMTTVETSHKGDNLIGRARSVSPRLSDGEDMAQVSSFGQNNRKVLPKSILDVVQRFESPPIERKSPIRVPPPSQLNALVGFGPVTSKSIQDKLYGIPIQHQIKITGENQSPGTPSVLSPQLQPSLNIPAVSTPPHLPYDHHHVNRPGREHRIPIIEKNEESPPAQKFYSYNDPRKQSSPSTDTPTNNIHIINVNMNSAGGNFREKHPDKTKGIKDLEQEEERLFHALRTGQVIPVEHRISPPRNNRNPTPEPRRSSPDVDILNNNNSRVAFAKERIRQSQEHPLTQQRLELQKRLPTPSSNLAAAIALQQGKNKFQVNGESTQTSQPRLHHIRIEREGESHRNQNGRHSWATDIQHRFGPGSSVADRVQQFEKYPAHIVTNGTSLREESGQSLQSHRQGQTEANLSSHPSNHIHYQYTTPHPPLLQQQNTPKEITHPIRKLDTVYHHPLGDPPKYESHLPKYEVGGTGKRTSGIDSPDSNFPPWRLSAHSPKVNESFMETFFSGGFLLGVTHRIT